MKAILSQIALMIGGVLSGITLLMNLYQDINLLTAAFRSVIVFIITVTLIFIFLRLFAAIVVRFVAEQITKKGAQSQQEQTNTNAHAGKRSRMATPPNSEKR